MEYAKWLGMDLEKDVDMFWIAREGLKARRRRRARRDGATDPRRVGAAARELEALQDDGHGRDLLLQLRERREHVGPPLR